MRTPLRRSYPLHIRFNDLDVYGHVNNAVYLTYFEEGRLQFFNDIAGTAWNWERHGIILARNEIDYKAPLLLSDRAHIEVWVSAVGRKSLTIEYLISKEAENARVECTVGKSVVVCINHATGETVPVPAEWVKVLGE